MPCTDAARHVDVQGPWTGFHREQAFSGESHSTMPVAPRSPGRHEGSRRNIDARRCHKDFQNGSQRQQCHLSRETAAALLPMWPTPAANPNLAVQVDREAMCAPRFQVVEQRKPNYASAAEMAVALLRRNGKATARVLVQSIELHCPPLGTAWLQAYLVGSSCLQRHGSTSHSSI